MKLTCRLRQRLLAHQAVLGQEPRTGSALARHLERCAECRECWETLRGLDLRLGALAPAPAPSENLLSAVWARIRRTRAPIWHAEHVPALAAVTIVLLLGSYFSWRGRDTRGVEDRSLTVHVLLNPFAQGPRHLFPDVRLPAGVFAMGRDNRRPTVRPEQAPPIRLTSGSPRYGSMWTIGTD